MGVEFWIFKFRLKVRHIGIDGHFVHYAYQVTDYSKWIRFSCIPQSHKVKKAGLAVSTWSGNLVSSYLCSHIGLMHCLCLSTQTVLVIDTGSLVASYHFHSICFIFLILSVKSIIPKLGKLLCSRFMYVLDIGALLFVSLGLLDCFAYSFVATSNIPYLLKQVGWMKLMI